MDPRQIQEIKRKAEAVYDNLPPEGQNCSREVFVGCMIEMGNKNRMRADLAQMTQQIELDKAKENTAQIRASRGTK